MCVHDGLYDSSVSALLRPIRRSSDPLTGTHLVPEPTPSLTAVSMASDSSMEIGECTPSTDGITSPPSLCLTQQLGQGAVGQVWRGVLWPVSEAGIVLDVAAKVGWFEDSRRKLLHEAKIYDLLCQQGVNGVPVLIGLFNDVDDQVPILVTSYAGSRIHTVDDSHKCVNVVQYFML
jgi:hypothetical protein